MSAHGSGHIKKLFAGVREHLSNAVVGGLIVMLTGFSPEDWFVHFMQAIHVPADTLKSWSFGLDPRVLLVLFGVAIIIGDQLLRRRAARPQEQTAGGGFAITAASQTSTSSQPQPATPSLALPETPSMAANSG